MHVLDKIVAKKQQEVKGLKAHYRLSELEESLEFGNSNPYADFQKLKAEEEFIFITEFKRKSPSEGHINPWVSIEDQINSYKKFGAHMISVLTDTPFFGGDYRDLRTASRLVAGSGVKILHKDFIIDPIQIALGRKMGADAVLLIARILDEDQLHALKTYAEGLGMMVLMEVHNADELEKIQGLDCAMVGVNNRDLDAFDTRVNRFNVLQAKLGKQVIKIAESGVHDTLSFKTIAAHGDGLLIGTGLMKQGLNEPLKSKFKCHQKYIFKACGLRQAEDLDALDYADLVGLNVSPSSKRKFDAFDAIDSKRGKVLVSKGLSVAELQAYLEQEKVNYVQLYVEDFGLQIPPIPRNVGVILSIPASHPDRDKLMHHWAWHVDHFILEGQLPGTGVLESKSHFQNVPYPFIMAGGINAETIGDRLGVDGCVGFDLASGCEVEGKFNLNRVIQFAQILNHQENISVC